MLAVYLNNHESILFESMGPFSWAVFALVCLCFQFFIDSRSFNEKLTGLGVPEESFVIKKYKWEEGENQFSVIVENAGSERG